MKSRISRISKIIIYCIICLSPFILNGCEEEGRLDFIDKNAPAPAPVEEVYVRPVPGGAVLYYTLPADKNLLYVRAEYEIRPGVIHEAKSSFLKDSLILEGFADEHDYDVKLYSVGKNTKMSEPVPVKVKPLKAPVRLATTNIRETFQGVAIDVENPESASLAIVLIGDPDNKGYMSDFFTFYLGASKRTFTYRGLDTIEYTFGVYVRDRWNNISDTIFGTVLPMYDVRIPSRDVWTEHNLPGDLSRLRSEYSMQYMWNGIKQPSGGYCEFHSVDERLPYIITWNLNQTVRLSRLKFWPRASVDDRWRQGHMREFEVWGSMAPNPNGELDDTWIPLGRFESVKPSGPGSEITQDDIEFAQAGIDFDFEPSAFQLDPNNIRVQYVRIRVLSTFAYASFSRLSIQELELYGVIEK